MDAKKPAACGCSKAECLRRYCECFSSGWFCTADCSCQGCRNTKDNEDEVEDRAERILKKKPKAFGPKITDDVGADQGRREPRRHVKGCACVKSECKRRYCECFKNEVGCTDRCQCKQCGNSFGVKGVVEIDAQQRFDDTGDSNGMPSGIDNEMYCPIEASTSEKLEASGPSWDIDQYFQFLN